MKGTWFLNVSKIGKRTVRNPVVNFAAYAPTTEMRELRIVAAAVIRKDIRGMVNAEYICAQLNIMLNIALSAPNSLRTCLLDNLTLMMVQKVHSSELDCSYTEKSMNRQVY